MSHSEEELEPIYWLNKEEWYSYKPGAGYRGDNIKSDSPERAKTSFEMWKKNLGF